VREFVLLLDNPLDRFPCILDPGFSGILEKEYGTQVVLPGDERMEWRPLQHTRQKVWICFDDL
jgi:hypothetical protein